MKRDYLKNILISLSLSIIVSLVQVTLTGYYNAITNTFQKTSEVFINGARVGLFLFVFLFMLFSALQFVFWLESLKYKRGVRNENHNAS